MKKVISICLLVALAVMTAGPAIATAAVNPTLETVGTGLYNGATGEPGANSPYVMAMWEMNGPYETATGIDADPEEDAQIDPSGEYQVNTTMSICGVVDSALGRANIKDVWGDVYYPEIALGSSHVDPVTGQPVPSDGCGNLVRECHMEKVVDANRALDLVCGVNPQGTHPTGIKNINNNLVWFNSPYDWNSLCNEAQSGVIVKKTADVYCCNFTMSYEDPAGFYKTEIWTTDAAGADGGTLDNNFEYEETLTYDVDFANIAYGPVVAGSWKDVSGDTTWTSPAGTNSATVRNTSSTRIQIGAWQNDMGLKETNGTVLVSYRGKIGDVAYTPYSANAVVSPTDPTHAAAWFEDTLDLSEKNEMDFSVLVTKFPSSLTGPFSGVMELSARKAPALTCPIPE